MDFLGKKLDTLKKKFFQQQEQQKTSQKTINDILEKTFPSFGELTQEIYMRGKKLIIKTKSKAFSNELFFQKETIEEELQRSLKEKIELIIY